MIKNMSAVAEPPAKTVATKSSKAPTEQDIAVRAHELFLQRGGEAGHEMEDWLQAERELRTGK